MNRTATLAALSAALLALAACGKGSDLPTSATYGSNVKLTAPDLHFTCVIGFNPYSHAWFADHHPQILRGLDSYDWKDGAASKLTPEIRKSFANLEHVEIARPDFLALDAKMLPSPRAELFRAKGMPIIAWTALLLHDRVVAPLGGIGQAGARGFICRRSDTRPPVGWGSSWRQGRPARSTGRPCAFASCPGAGRRHPGPGDDRWGLPARCRGSIRPQRTA